MSEKIYEFCRVQLVKGTGGSLNVSWFQPHDPPVVRRFALMDPETGETGLERLVAQLGMGGWKLKSQNGEDWVFCRVRKHSRALMDPQPQGFLPRDREEV